MLFFCFLLFILTLNQPVVEFNEHFFTIIHEESTCETEDFIFLDSLQVTESTESKIFVNKRAGDLYFTGLSTDDYDETTYFEGEEYNDLCSIVGVFYQSPVVLADNGETCDLYAFDPHKNKFEHFTDGFEYNYTYPYQQKVFDNSLFISVWNETNHCGLLEIYLDKEVKTKYKRSFDGVVFSSTLKNKKSAYINQFKDPDDFVNEDEFVLFIGKEPDKDLFLYKIIDTMGIEEVGEVNIAKGGQGGDLEDYVLFFVSIEDENYIYAANGEVVQGEPEFANIRKIHTFDQQKFNTICKKQSAFFGDYFYFLFTFTNDTVDDAIYLKCDAVECEEIDIGDISVFNDNIFYTHSKSIIVVDNEGKKILAPLLPQEERELYVVDEPDVTISILNIFNDVIFFQVFFYFIFLSFFKECSTGSCDLIILRPDQKPIVVASSEESITRFQLVVGSLDDENPNNFFIFFRTEDGCNSIFKLDFKTDGSCTPSCDHHSSGCLNGECDCEGNFAHTSEDILDCEACKPNYVGENCDKYCNDAVNCSGHGECEYDQEIICNCDDHWDGKDCNICKPNWDRELNCTKCINGYRVIQNNCEEVECYGKNIDDDNVCSKNGYCSYDHYDEETKKFEGICTCIGQNYSGDCSIYYCFEVFYNSSNVCSGNGVCLSPNKCACKEGYTKGDCSGIEDDYGFWVISIIFFTIIVPLMTCLFLFSCFTYYRKKKKREQELRINVIDGGTGGTFVKLEDEEMEDVESVEKRIKPLGKDEITDDRKSAKVEKNVTIKKVQKKGVVNAGDGDYDDKEFDLGM